MMIERYIDLWTAKTDARVITTNGFVKANGRCVMGRGCALEARDRFPGVDLQLGSLIKAFGNHVLNLGKHGSSLLFSFPVKRHWQLPAELALIARSAAELEESATDMGLRSVVIPRPGCGNGMLSWDQVRKVVEPFFDDRFIIVSKEQ